MVALGGLYLFGKSTIKIFIAFRPILKAVWYRDKTLLSGEFKDSSWVHRLPNIPTREEITDEWLNRVGKIFDER